MDFEETLINQRFLKKNCFLPSGLCPNKGPDDADLGQKNLFGQALEKAQLDR